MSTVIGSTTGSGSLELVLSEEEEEGMSGTSELDSDDEELSSSWLEEADSSTLSAEECSSLWEVEEASSLDRLDSLVPPQALSKRASGKRAAMIVLDGFFILVPFFYLPVKPSGMVVVPRLM